MEDMDKIVRNFSIPINSAPFDFYGLRVYSDGETCPKCNDKITFLVKKSHSDDEWKPMSQVDIKTFDFDCVLACKTCDFQPKWWHEYL
jgi:hypothetical protein